MRRTSFDCEIRHRPEFFSALAIVPLLAPCSYFALNAPPPVALEHEPIHTLTDCQFRVIPGPRKPASGPTELEAYLREQTELLTREQSTEKR